MLSEHFKARLPFLLLFAAFIYAGLYGFTFLVDPLGLAPVLDARENLALADRIAAHGLPEEPVYRALLYPYLLSIVGASPAIATIGGVIFHLLSAFLVASIASLLWCNRRAAFLSGLLYAFYPVALYFSGQVLDITFSLTLFLAGLYFSLRSLSAERRSKAVTYALVGGVLGGFAVLARPNFLPPVLCFPLLPLLGIFATRRLRTALPSVVVSALSLMSLLLLQGALNYDKGGEFRILPWQGSYNLYAANRDGANGKFYKQQIAFDEIQAGSNPTRMESELLYHQSVGEGAARDVGAMNTYWKSRLIDEIKRDPSRWLALMVRKVFYLGNDWEQYNNLTYAYHKSRLPVLSWNPLGWGVVLIVAFIGVVLGAKKAPRPILLGLCLCAAAYTAGLLLFFVSARFRLPLVPFLCVGAGGLIFFAENFYGKRLRIILSGVVVLAVLSFGNWFNAKDRETYIQDEVLLASANSRIGEDLKALHLARNVLIRDSSRADARRLELVSLFNLWIQERSDIYWLELEPVLKEISRPDASTEFIRGVYHWRSADLDTALEAWRKAVERYGDAALSSIYALEAVGYFSAQASHEAAVNNMKDLLEL